MTGPLVARPAGISVESVAKSYPDAAGVIRAVEGVSVAVPPGGSLAITGPSGCGKSTLLSLIGGLEPPTSGRVVVGGTEISGLTGRERARLRRESFGFVFQKDDLLPYLTAVENVALQAALQPHRAGGGRCLDLLAQLGVAECADRLPDQLSGGQRLRVAIARAVVHEPCLILADEPTGSVDPDNAQTVVDVLLAAQQSAAATLVVVTHDPDVAGRMEHGLALRDGRPDTGRGAGGLRRNPEL